MKNLFMSMLVTSAAMYAASSQAQAFCSQEGAIVSIFASPGSGESVIDVKKVGWGLTQYRYTTSNPVYLDGLLKAEATHQRVKIYGGASDSACGAEVNGLSSGGVITSIGIYPHS